MKKLIIFLMILLFVLVGCVKEPIDDGDDDDPKTEVDEIAPLFLNASNNELPKIRHKVDQDIDLLSNINVIDNISKDITLTIIDDGGYKKSNPGVYKIVIEAKDEAGNSTTVNRLIEVYYLTKIKYPAFMVNSHGIEYQFNNETALEYSQGGAKFRNTDIIQIMEKDFFISKYNEYKNTYIDNGNMPYLANGVILLLNSNLQVLHMRIAPNIEVDETSIVTSASTWTNTKSSTGGGNFKGLLNVINELLVTGGYVIFAPSNKDNKAKSFLIKNLYYSNYDGTNLSLFEKDIKLNNLNIKFEENYEETIEMVDGEIIGSIVKTKMIYDGIPITTYYKNDKKPKKLLYFFHGFAGNRETGIMGRGEILANLGYYVIAIDAYMHGEREPEFFKQLNYANKQKDIINIIIQTAKDAKHLYHKYFKNLDGVDTTNVYAYGVSMGAAVTFYLATIMDELTTFASIVGSPAFVEYYEYKQVQYGWVKDEYYEINLESYRLIDPLLNYELLRNKNIFMGVGTKDTTVPLKFAKALSTKLPIPNVVYKEYDTDHNSTPKMQEDAYNFLIKN